MTVQLQAADRWQAIEELIGHLLDRGQILPQHHQEILAAVKKREQAMSTGISLLLQVVAMALAATLAATTTRRGWLAAATLKGT